MSRDRTVKALTMEEQTETQRIYTKFKLRQWEVLKLISVQMITISYKVLINHVELKPIIFHSSNSEDRKQVFSRLLCKILSSLE